MERWPWRKCMPLFAWQKRWKSSSQSVEETTTILILCPYVLIYCLCIHVPSRERSPATAFPDIGDLPGTSHDPDKIQGIVQTGTAQDLSSVGRFLEPWTARSSFKRTLLDDLSETQGGVLFADASSHGIRAVLLQKQKRWKSNLTRALTPTELDVIQRNISTPTLQHASVSEWCGFLIRSLVSWERATQYHSRHT